ncbi:MAG TPA: ArsA family ATPase [Candidatus Korarchaeota archaeon]|nr:ArsA family ATPase [Candidatus Korarchaeota archaeon]
MKVTNRNTKILSFWGKGGVGKTTCAASASVYLASKGQKVLILTSDPTPSLSDIFDEEIGSSKKKLAPRLEAIELNEETVLDMWKKRFGDEVYRVVSSFFPVDREIIEYISGAPGIADEFILAYILDLFVSKEYDYIIWDAAPAGGSLRLLRIEEKFYKHLGEASKLYLSLKSTLDKIRMVEGRDPLSIIRDWRKLAEDVLKLISSDKFSVYIVSIPEWLGFSQTKRIVKELREFNVRVPALIINQVATKGICDCDLWTKKVEIHEKYVNLLMKTYSPLMDVLVIPMQSYEIKGIEALDKFSRNLSTLLDKA